VKYAIKTSNFPQVVRQHISGALLDLIPSLSALNAEMKELCWSTFERVMRHNIARPVF